MDPNRFGFGPREERCAAALIELACVEDLADVGDLTSRATIPESATGQADFVARRAGTISGLPVVSMLADRFGVELLIKTGDVADGGAVVPGEAIRRAKGSMRALLAFERTALNFLQRLSGVASLTARYVSAVRGTRAQILDTRKTTPGWRALEKYAVRCGGGVNHRIGLYDSILIKDNHLAALSSEPDAVRAAIRAAKALASPPTIVEVEVTTLEQFESALECEPDIVLLDNMPLAMMSEAVERRDARGATVLLEASGGVTLDTVASIAATGVERISVGALTHSASALDIALEIDPSA